MSDLQKLYHWANIILNPLTLVLLFLSTLGNFFELAGAVAIGWTLISAVFNEKLRSWVIKLFAGFFVGAGWVGWVGSIMGAIILIAVAVIISFFGFFFVLIFTWITSLKAILDYQRGLV